MPNHVVYPVTTPTDVCFFASRITSVRDFMYEGVLGIHVRRQSARRGRILSFLALGMERLIILGLVLDLRFFERDGDFRASLGYDVGLSSGQ